MASRELLAVSPDRAYVFFLAHHITVNTLLREGTTYLAEKYHKGGSKYINILFEKVLNIQLNCVFCRVKQAHLHTINLFIFLTNSPFFGEQHDIVVEARKIVFFAPGQLFGIGVMNNPGD